MTTILGYAALALMLSWTALGLALLRLALRYADTLGDDDEPWRESLRPDPEDR